MKKFCFVNLIRLAITTGALGMLIIPAAGQESPPKAAAASQATQAVKIPKGCENGKMRCVTNAVRWQVAIQNADRRAKNMKNNNGKGPKK